PPPTSINLLVSNPQLNSDGVSSVTLTALVKDSGNRAMAEQTVTFTADSGILTIDSPVTSASGQATATLGTGGDQKNRTITVTAASVP
ncbi:MAG: Ig-like domain-containing protein, partial [Proteobacteria bacterium]|nr:Ig-like domain-containing protein [Pseudomonadota bacterium]